MFNPITSITKLTTSTLKSCAMTAASTFNPFSNYVLAGGDLPSQATIDFWVADTQRGLDAFFNDQFDTAQHIFTQYAAESPFHAVGYALMGYVEAMLGFEIERITVALARLSDAQALAHTFAKRAKHGKGHYAPQPLKTAAADSSSDIDVNGLEVGQDSSICFSPKSSISSANSNLSAGKLNADEDGKSKSTNTAIGIDYELLEANCMLMSATIQFLRDNWIDYMKAAYKLRKAYKMYENMFEVITGITTETYAARLRKDSKKQQQQKQNNSQARQTGYVHRKNSVSGPTVDVVGRGIHPLSVSPSLTATLLSASPPSSPLPTDKSSASAASQPDNESITSDTIGISKPTSPVNELLPSFAAILANTQFEAPRDKKRYSLWATRSRLERMANDQAISSVSNIQLPSSERTKPAKQRKRASLPLFGIDPSKEFANDMMWPPKKPSINGTDVPIATVGKALESGVFFGVGLFALIFSLLPPKANKLLNTLGFHSSRPFALHLLHTSYSSTGLYSPLSALTLLAYYTNLSLFVHPKLLPYSLRFQDARDMLDNMKAKYPNGRIWMLVDGKLCKLEGFTRRGVETLRDARRKDSVARVDEQKSTLIVSTSKAGKVTGPSNDFPRSRMQQESMNGGMAQLQALAVYEMGWGQIWLGDYFQASETFFRLESMNNWSRAFYHYIATCCMFADEEYDKAAIEFLQIPDILRRQKQLGGRLLPNEIFAERKILGWKKKAEGLVERTKSPTQGKSLYGQCLNGDTLRQTVVVNPLWELIYLWNGIPHVNTDVLTQMKIKLQSQIAHPSTETQSTTPLPPDAQSDTAILYLLYATVIRELGHLETSEEYLNKLIAMDKCIFEDRWAIAYAMYELAIVAAMDPNRTNEAKKWVKNAENFFQGNHQAAHSPSDLGSNNGDYDWENRLHVRCQLLLERLDESS